MKTVLSILAAGALFAPLAYAAADDATPYPTIPLKGPDASPIQHAGGVHALEHVLVPDGLSVARWSAAQDDLRRNTRRPWATMTQEKNR